MIVKKYMKKVKYQPRIYNSNEKIPIKKGYS